MGIWCRIILWVRLQNYQQGRELFSLMLEKQIMQYDFGISLLPDTRIEHDKIIGIKCVCLEFK